MGTSLTLRPKSAKQVPIKMNRVNRHVKLVQTLIIVLKAQSQDSTVYQVNSWTGPMVTNVHLAPLDTSA